MQYFLHIARSHVHIAQSEGVTFCRTTFVLREENIGSHFVVDRNWKTSKMVPLASVLLYE